ncbi:MAG: hypothetical protein ABJK37_24475 [Paraglaciecola sp.]|uniref:hypothetical protein n=1 Tax=Paraglaciecola sp. TaxID=1920173 RepID=UPI00329A4850
MTLTFLCSTHRDWVYFHPQEALANLDEAQIKGELLMQRDKWQEATTFLGCAFETTEILMELQGAEKSFLLSRLTSLAICLAVSFKKLDAIKHQHIVLHQAEQKLQAVANTSLGNKSRLAFVQECILAIRNYQQKVSRSQQTSNTMDSALLH